MKRYPPEVVQQFQDLAAELRSRTVHGHLMGICDNAMVLSRAVVSEYWNGAVSAISQRVLPTLELDGKHVRS
jgi:hypothetical protein